MRYTPIRITMTAGMETYFATQIAKTLLTTIMQPVRLCTNRALRLRSFRVRDTQPPPKLEKPRSRDDSEFLRIFQLFDKVAGEIRGRKMLGKRHFANQIHDFNSVHSYLLISNPLTHRNRQRYLQWFHLLWRSILGHRQRAINHSHHPYPDLQ